MVEGVNVTGTAPPGCADDRIEGQRAAALSRRSDLPCAHPTTPPALAAPVHGFPAFVIAKLLEEHLPARLVRLEQMAEQGRLHPGYLAEIAVQWAAIREAADQWSRYRASASGSAEAPVTEMPRSSSEIDTTKAAELLGVSESRVRQQLRAGLLQGRKTSRVWLVDRIDVELRQGAERDLLRRNAGPVPQPRTH